MRPSLPRTACFVIAALLTTLAIPAAAGPQMAEKGGKCAGLVGVQCPKGQWCDLMAGACRGADISGKCEDEKPVCTGLYRPVCGCDGKTYANDCYRRAAQAQLDHEGVCKSKKKY